MAQEAKRALLRVIPPESARLSWPRQDCSRCLNMTNCWRTGTGQIPKEEHIITNLLVCRIKRGIEVNRSTRLFLQMVRPKLKNYAKVAIKGTSIDMDTALADLESQTIEYIQQRYMMGEIAYPLHWLFGHPNGFVYRYASNYGKKTKRYEETHELFRDEAPGSADETINPYDEIEEDQTEETRMAREVIEDGLTLTSEEYRVMKFCLQNAMEGKRPLNGLHAYLGRVMGLPRDKVIKIYKSATDKIFEMCG